MAKGEDFNQLKEGIFCALVDTTRTAGQISNEDLAFLHSSNRSIIPLLEQQDIRLLQLARRLTKTASSGTEVSTPQLEDLDSIEDNWKCIVDVFDNLLEKADGCLDEYTGAVRRLSPSQEEQMKKAATPARKRRPDKAYRTQNIAKPQLLFDNVPTNDELTPFKPLLRSKPHALIPLEESLVLAPSSDGSQQYALHFRLAQRKAATLSTDMANTHLRYKHPYEAEIKESRYPAAIYAKADPIPSTPYESTVATMVDTPEALLSMLEELKVAKEIAVDLEHHDEHSYIGLVSLMQISTRDRDWIIDTLRPWRQELQALNEIFTDPKILKVFHGAYMDMIWLQRDFGLYVVGLFDTFHASRSLGYPKNGLAYLLKHFVDFDAAKQYQMADWRIRPLPEEMFNYARSDTHFLLYIYDNLRNELIDKSDTSEADGNLIEVVMDKSKGEALQRYERPLYDSERGLGAMGWYPLLCRTPALFNREQFAVFRAAHHWRDIVAREEDENVHTVMAKQVLYNIARETPTDEASLYGCSHPMSKIFSKRKKELFRVVQQAKRLGATGPDMKEFIQSVQPLHVERNISAATDHRAAPAHPTPLEEFSASKQQPSLPELVARSESSVFWGPTVMGTNSSRGLEAKDKNESLRLALPLPQLTAEIFKESKATRTADSSTHQMKPGPRVEHQYVKTKTSQQEEVFVVKQAGGSRKRKASQTDGGPEPTSPTANSHAVESIDRNFDEAEVPSSSQRAELDEKKRLKKAKKEARRLEKARQAEGMPGNDGGGDVEAFDYASAPSVLHAKRSGDDPDGSKFADPYSKSMLAPKGIGKRKIEIGGKSFTFKS